MNNRKSFLVVSLIVVLFLFNGCQKEPTHLVSGVATGQAVSSTTKEEKETPEPETRLILKHEGKLYYNSGEECPYTGGRCGVMDGKISSTVAPGEIPKKNNQSNFGKYEFQFCEHGIDVFVDGKILQFVE